MFILSINTTKRTWALILYLCTMHYLFLDVYFLGARFGCWAYARELDYSGRTKRSSSRLLHHLADRIHHQPIGQSIRRSLLLGVHSAANQLIGLLGACRPVIPAIRCLDFIVSYAGCSPAALGTSRCSDSSFNCRQLNWDSLAFIFSVQESPVELGTPLVVRFCYIFASLWLSWCAIRLLHAIRIRVLILGSTSTPW
jgi:hypothetical protein